MTVILGLAHEVPAKRMVGSVERAVVAEPTGASDLALAAAGTALERAGLAVDDVELVVFSTMTPDVTFPGAACFLQRKLGCGTTGALDLRGQCSGFLVGLMTADAFLRAGNFSNVLLACGEVHSSGLDRSPAGIHIAERFGDGAAVAVLGVGGGESGVEAVVCKADGRHYEDYWIEYPKSSQSPHRITVEDLRAGKHYLKIDFDAVAGFGRRHLADAVRRVLSDAAASVDDVDCFVLSHILPEVAEDAAKQLSLDSSKVRIAGVEHGHLSAASLPVALSEAVEAGEIGPGARVCLATCGAGPTWGAALIRL